MLRWIRRLAVLVALLAACAALLAWWLLRGSLAPLDGELALPGLAAPGRFRATTEQHSERP